MTLRTNAANYPVIMAGGSFFPMTKQPKQPGRPSRLELDPNAPLPVGQHVSDIDVRGRVYLPGWLISNLPWIEPGLEVLAIFDEPGLIRLCSWAEHSEPVISRRRQLAAAGDLEGIRFLQDRYRQIHIPADSRPVLGEGAVVHLGLTESSNPYVYLVHVGDSFRIMAPRYRDQELERVHSTFSSLP